MAKTLFPSLLRMQIEPPLKAALEEAARRDGTTVSEWARRSGGRVMQEASACGMALALAFLFSIVAGLR